MLLQRFDPLISKDIDRTDADDPEYSLKRFHSTVIIVFSLAMNIETPGFLLHNKRAVHSF